MASFGSGALIFALVVCAYGIGASLYGVRRDEARFVDSGRRAVYALVIVLASAFVVLEVALLRNDYALKTVADTSSATTPLFYKAAAVWSSQEGSLLLWALLSSIWSSLVLYLVKGRMRDVAGYATAILLAFDAFFIALMVFYASPFLTNNPVPVEGAGLDPLLRFPTMMIHPPMLYSGYTLCIVPLAFGMGALIARKIDGEWIRATRRFALAAWLFLGVGIVLGAFWSYSELGWGGYWGWDPVENAALMPWLICTAFIHSLMIQEKRGMLKMWNVSLGMATGILAIMGTFLVRSGVLSSIHAFGGATLGVPFVCLIGILIGGSIYLVISRRAMLASEHRLDSLVSREAVFLLANMALVGLCFVIFWGTWFPLISEALTGRQASVGPPWFDRYTVPLALVIVALSGVGPLIAWRRATISHLRANMLRPLLAALAALAALLALGVGKPPALALFACAAFTIAAVLQEVWRGTRVRGAATGQPPPLAMLGLMRRNRRRYGGYIVHVGVALLLIGVAASSSFMSASEPIVARGRSVKIGGYTFHYVRPTATVTPQNDAAHTGATLSLGAVLRVSRAGRYVTTLHPAEGFYASPEAAQGSVGHLIGGEDVSHVSLSSTPARNLWSAIEPDISAPRLQHIIEVGNRTIPMNRPADQWFVLGYLARAYLHSPPPAHFNLRVQPLLIWIWIGAIIAAGGGLISLWPAPDVLARRVSVGAALRRRRRRRRSRAADLARA